MHKETVLEVHHWSERVFTFKTTRDKTLRFKSGEFTMVGLEHNNKPLLRAYSLASANHEDYLEFLSIKVPDGALTSKLQHINPGEEILVGKKPVGTLVLDYLLPGENLFLIGTGTGLAPFLGLIKDPETYEKFENVVLVHSVRNPDELVYASTLYNFKYSIYGDLVQGFWDYVPIVTGAPLNQQRITTQIINGSFPNYSNTKGFDPQKDRIMVCGSEAVTKDVLELSKSLGFVLGSNASPGTVTIEKAFVEK